MKRAVLATAFTALALPAFAGATSTEIKAAVEGNTIQGGMADGTAYSEFYEAGGVVKADGYTATWSVENDQMCWDYGEGKACWGMRIEGDEVTWLKDGAEEGTGTILSGNPNNF